MPDYGFISNTASPMDAMGKMAATMNAINQNKLFLGKEMAGRAIQESIDPNTGAVDFQNVNRLISTNPKIAPYAQEALQQTLAAQGASTANTSAQQQLAGAYSAALFQDIAAAKTPEDAVTAIARGVTLGRYPQGFATSFVSGAPTNGRTFSDAMKALQDAGAIQSGSEAAMEARFGMPGAVDTGAQNVGVVTNRVTGERNLMGGEAAGITKTLSPESASQMIELIEPGTGVKHLVPKSALVTGTGEARSGPGVGAQTSLAPGAAEAMTSEAQGAASILNADRADTAGSGQRITVLRKVDELLGAPGGTTGPGTQVVNGWRNFLLAHAPALASMTNGGIDEAKIRAATQDELKKYMVQMAGAASAQYGQGTNEKLAVAASGNPNPDMSTLANRDVTRMNIALERAKQARLAAFDAAGEPAQNYGRFTTRWNREVDPRAFMLDLLSPADRRKMMATIDTDAEKKAFLRGRDAAVSAGLYSMADIPR